MDVENFWQYIYDITFITTASVLRFKKKNFSQSNVSFNVSNQIG